MNILLGQIEIIVICKQLFDSIYTSKIYVCPNILVLILNRGKGNIFDVKLDFTERLDIRNLFYKEKCLK